MQGLDEVVLVGDGSGWSRCQSMMGPREEFVQVEDAFGRRGPNESRREVGRNRERESPGGISIVEENEDFQYGERC